METSGKNKDPGSHRYLFKQKNAVGEPLIIHNINAGVKEEDILRKYKIVDYFRVFKGKI